jgi:hypothetical protein
MNQLEDRTSLADQLMMGPDGAVYALRTGTLRAPSSSKPGEGGGRFAYSAEVPRRDGGQPTICFSYAAEGPRRDGGNIPLCFKYSAETPRRDRGDVPVCFKFSAEGPHRDGGDVPLCFKY